MNIKVKTISFLKPNPKPCVRRPCIWWGFLPSLTRTNMIWVDTRPKLDESPTNNKAQSYMVTSLIPPGSVAKSLNLGYQLPLCLEPTHYVLCGPTSLALWIEWLEPSPVAPSPNPCKEIEWSRLPILYGGGVFCPNGSVSCGHWFSGITNGHSIHAGPP